MLTMELWEKLMLATMSTNEVTVVMGPIVREIADVFFDDLLGLPPNWEIEFGIKFTIAKAIRQRLYKA